MISGSKSAPVGPCNGPICSRYRSRSSDLLQPFVCNGLMNGRRAHSDSDEDYVEDESVNVCASLEGPSEGGNEDNVEVEVDFDPKNENSPKGRGGAIKTKVNPGGFYKYAYVTSNVSNTRVALVIEGKDGRKLRFDQDDFMRVFNLKCEGGFCTTKVKAWPEGIPTYDELKTLLNNDFTFSPSDNRKDIRGAKTNFLDGDDKFALQVINECIFCTSSNDSRVPDSQMLIIYYLRNNLYVNIPGLIGNIVHDTICRHRYSSFPLCILISYIVKS
ncbi:hypothetical protein LIER_15769 [Lithospermum erythrorhizon]|uniref:Uncharacterized protein n=1 Tax=Lithospermum erythrorhizon TaxID=34254 RepID=A0AAV3Q622_LITER